MPTLEDVAKIASSFPEVKERDYYGGRAWFIGKKAFAWVRGFSKADLKRFGDETPPDGPIVAVRVGDVAEKEAILAEHKKGFFTIPHFDGYPAVLVQLKKVGKGALREVITDGWLACAPSRLTDQYTTGEEVLSPGASPRAGALALGGGDLFQHRGTVEVDPLARDAVVFEEEERRHP